MAKQYYDENGNPVKKKHSILKWIGIGVGVLFVLGIIGMVFDDDNQGTQSGQPVANQEQNTEQQQPAEQESTEAQSDQQEEEENAVVKGETPLELGKIYALGDYLINVYDVQRSTDVEGNPVVVLTYNWGNYSNRDQSPMVAIDIAGYQNGTETNSFGVVASLDAEPATKTAKPESIVKGVQTSVGIDDPSQPLTIEIGETFDFGDNKLILNIDPQ